MNRRDFLKAAGAIPVLGRIGFAAAEEWTFIHFTDPHIQPELKADQGCRQAFRKMSSLKPDFVVSGGDLVYDTLAVDRKRADLLFGMYKEAVKHLEAPLHDTMGNHDVFGLYTKSGVQPSDEKYGKKMFEDYIGKRYYSFDHKGWHFIVLDSIGMTPERQYIGEIDDDQLTWLKNDLESTGRATPVVMVTHIPLLTSFPHIIGRADRTAGLVITNAKEVLGVIEPYNIKTVLQGHTHICERLRFKNTEFITSGAISANWWRGPRMGFDEGFAVLTVKGDDISWRYETFGWKAVEQA